MKKQDNCQPIVDLKEIIFLNVKPKAVQRAVFHVKRLGNNHKTAVAAKTEPWLEITKKQYSPQKDELHFEVKATGKEPGKTYTDCIEIKINGQTLKIKVKLTVRKKRKITPIPIAKPATPVAKHTAVQPIKKDGKFPGWIICLMVLLIIGGGFLFLLRMPQDKGKPPESLDKWIENTLVPSLTSRPNEWYEYWHNDWTTVGDDIWVVGGITFTTQNYLFQTINFVYHSPDNGKSWRVSWRTDLQTDTRFFGAEKINAKNREKISVILRGQFNRLITIQTTNKGLTWAIK